MWLGMSWQTFAVVGTIVTTAIFGAGIIAISKHFVKKEFMDNVWILYAAMPVFTFRTSYRQKPNLVIRFLLLTDGILPWHMGVLLRA